MNTNITIKNPNEPATNAQKKVIGHAIKQGEYPRFSTEGWAKLTKGAAAEIITELRDGLDIPASDAQKKKLADLIHSRWSNAAPTFPSEASSVPYRYSSCC